MSQGPATYALHAAGGLVRQLWPTESLIEEVIEEDPLLGMCEKQTNWSYEVVHHPLGYGANQGIARTYAKARAIRSQTKSSEFQIATREMFASLSLEGKLLRTFEYTRKQALLVDPVTREGEATIDRMRRRFSKAIHGDGVGVIGRIKAGSLAGDTFELDDPNDLKNFEPDTVVQFEETGVTGGTLRDAGQEATVLSIGTEDSPTVTFTAGGLTGIAGLANGDRAYHTGTYDNDFIIGMEGFNPEYSMPGSPPGTLLTCDRDVNPGWLAGRNMDGSGLSVYQCIKKAARRSFDAGNKPDTYVLSTRRFEKLEFEFDNKLVMQKFPAADVGKYKMGVSYSGVVVQGPRGPIKVLPSTWAPDTIDRCGEIDSLVMGSIGPLVHWDLGNGPGKMAGMRTEDDTDGRELRAVSDPAFLNKKPGCWVRVATGDTPSA